jgi:hypothetical protein
VIRESHEQAMPMIYFDRGHKLSQEFTALYEELATPRAARDARTAEPAFAQKLQ